MSNMNANAKGGVANQVRVKDPKQELTPTATYGLGGAGGGAGDEDDKHDLSKQPTYGFGDF